MRTAALVAALLFIHLAGQASDPWLSYPVYIAWGLGGLLALVRLRRLPSAPVLLGLATIGLTAANGINPAWGWRRLATVLGYVISYYWLRRSSLNLAPALAIAGAVLSLSIVGGILPGNPNICAGFIYLSVPAALAAWSDVKRWYTLAVGVVALVMTGCQGAWLASGVAVLVYLGQRWLLALAPVAGVGQALWHPASWTDRAVMWLKGLADLSVLGRGYGTAIYSIPSGIEHYHAHCLPLTIAVEAGIPGLATLAYGVWRVLPRLATGWAGPLLAGLLAWSLIDEVVWFWGPGLLACWLVAEVMRDA